MKFNRKSLTAAAVALAPLSAFAQTTGAFDPADVTSKIETYGGYGVTILAAFILARWALKAMHLIK